MGGQIPVGVNWPRQLEGIKSPPETIGDRAAEQITPSAGLANGNPRGVYAIGLGTIGEGNWSVSEHVGRQDCVRCETANWQPRGGECLGSRRYSGCQLKG